jgi:hypothetical protein
MNVDKIESSNQAKIKWSFLEQTGVKLVYITDKRKLPISEKEVF